MPGNNTERTEAQPTACSQKGDLAPVERNEPALTMQGEVDTMETPVSAALELDVPQSNEAPMDTTSFPN